MIKITYFHTLYKKNVTSIVFGDIEFKDGQVYFSASGHRYAVLVEHIVSIQKIED